MSRIGEKIIIARNKKAMTQKQVAQKCGVSESFIRDVESGRKVAGEDFIKRLSKVLEVNLEEKIYEEEYEVGDEDDVRNNAPVQKNEVKTAVPEWESAFSNIIKDIPIYDALMESISGYKHLPLIDKKVDGFNPDKVVFITMPDNSLSGFRVKKDDIVMVNLNSEIINGFCLLEFGGKRVIRQVKRLDGNNVLLISHGGELKTETVSIRDMKVIGHCIKAEIDLTK